MSYPDGIQVVEARHLYYEPTKQTAGVEQAKRRQSAYGIHIKSVAEFSDSWGAEIAKMGATYSHGSKWGGCSKIR
jgi:hypothetical protein